MIALTQKMTMLRVCPGDVMSTERVVGDNMYTLLYILLECRRPLLSPVTMPIVSTLFPLCSRVCFRNSLSLKSLVRLAHPTLLFAFPKKGFACFDLSFVRSKGCCATHTCIRL